MVTRIAALLIFTFSTALHLGAQVRVTTTDLLYIKQRMQIGTDTSLNFTSIVDTITAASTHHQAPSALAVYEAIGEYGGGGGAGAGGDVGIVNAADYGATGDGVTDDTDSLQAAIDAAAGKRLWIPGGRYVVSSQLDIPDNTEITMSDSTIIDISDIAAAGSLGAVRAMQAVGSAGTATTVGADIALSATDITLASTAGIFDGQMIMVSSTEPLFPGYTNRYKSWVTIVDSVLSGTVVRIANKALYAIDAVGGSYSATVTPYTPAMNVRIRGGKIVGGGFEKGHTGIYLSNTMNCSVDGVTIDSCECAGVWMGTGISTAVRNCRIMNVTSPEYVATLGYGVLIGGGFGAIVENNYFERCRHSVAAGGVPVPYNAIISGNYSYNCGLGTNDYDCHGATAGFVFENNTTHAGPNGRGGFVIRSVDCVLKGNHVYGGSIGITNADGITPTTFPLGRITLSDNVIKDNTSGYGIEISGGGISYLSIEGGSIENCSIGIRASSTSQHLKISGISFVNLTSHSIELDDCTGVSVSNCTFDDATTGLSTLSSCSDVSMSNCVGQNITNSLITTYLTDNITVSNCIVSGITSASGMYFNRSNNVAVSNCLIDMNTSSYDGIRAWGSAATAHNISVTNTKVTGAYKYGLYCFTNSDTIRAVNNDFRTAITAPVYAPDASTYYFFSNVGHTVDHGDITESGTGPGLNIDANVIDSTNICTGCISVTDLGQHGASSGQVLKWNGTQWAPAADSGGSQSLSIDSTLLTSLERFGVSISGGNTVNFDVPRATLDTFSLSGTTLSASVSTDVFPAYTVSFSGWDTDASNDHTGSGAATQVTTWSSAGSLTGSNTLAYETNTLSMYPTANDTLLAVHGTGSIIFGLRSFTDPYNGAVNAYDFGGLTDDSRVFLRGYGIYPKAPFYQEQTAGIGFRGTTGDMYLHTNGDYYTATLAGENGTTNRNVSYYFVSGGATTSFGNPVIFQNIFSNNDSTANAFEYISRNTASGGVTIADSALMRFTSWDRGIQFNLTQAGNLGLKMRQPLYSLDVNATDGIRIPRGNTAQRPAGTPAGVIRFNTDSTSVEVGTGSSWATIGSVGAGGGGVTDHGALTGLSDDDHTQYALLAGRATGQTLTGGTASGDDLTLRSTTNATKGDVFIADQGGNIVVGGGATASELHLLEPSGSGSNYTAFKTQAQSADATYTLPASSTDGYLKNTSGTWSWGTPGDILAGGNTNGATVTIGTNDAQSLVLETNNADVITINSTGNVGIGTTPGGMKLAVNYTDVSTSGTPIGMQVKTTLSPASNSSGSSRSLNMANYLNSSGINFTGSNRSAWFENRVINAGAITNLYGLSTYGLLMGSDAATIGTVTKTAGVEAQSVSSFSNSIAGTVTTGVGVLVNNVQLSSLTMTNNVGLNVSALSGATNHTSVLLGTNTAPTGNFGIYSVITDDSYIAGQLGLGTTTATAVLHLKAGTASANTAPLKFTSGTNMTTAEAGSMEYDGTELYFSPSTTRQKLVRSLNGSGTLNFGSTAAGTSADLTITVTGAADGDPVILGVPNGSTLSNGCFTAWVSATNTVTVRFTNNDLTNALDPASGTFKVTVQK